MSRLGLWIACVGIAVLVSCAAPDYALKGELQGAIFPSSEFERFLSTEQKNVSWKKISEVSGSYVWESADHKLLAISRNGRAVALVEPGESWTTYYLFGGSDKVMRYKVNSRDVEGAIVDFVYEAL